MSTTATVKPIQLLLPTPNEWVQAVKRATSTERIEIPFRLSESPDQLWINYFVRIFRLWYEGAPPRISGNLCVITCMPSEIPLYRAIAKSVIAEANARVRVFRHYSKAQEEIKAFTKQRRADWEREKRKPAPPLLQNLPTREGNRLIDERLQQTHYAETSLQSYLSEHEMDHAMKLMVDEDLRESEAVTATVAQDESTSPLRKMLNGFLNKGEGNE